MEEKVKEKKNIERVVVNSSLRDKLIKLVVCANESMQGMAEISKSDIVNLLLEEQSDELSAAQIKKLKATHIDQVKYAYWLAKQIKDAKASGQSVSIQELLAKNLHIFGERPKGGRKQRKHDEPNPTAPEEP